MENTVLKEVETTYGKGAPWYDRLVTLFALGQERRLRREMAKRLGLKPGDTVVDLACGTGLNFEALEGAVGPEGKIIGVDCSPDMLAQAQKKMDKHGWWNIELIRGDAADFALSESVDAAVCTLAIGLFPDRRRLLKRMISAVKPGGRVLIADGKLSERWYGLLLNPLLRWLGNPWIPPGMRGAYWEGKPWEELEELIGRVEHEEYLWGTLYAAYGTVPGRESDEQERE
ncbi:MAG: class I SAM-dependent methyltransferase [Anaerolineae bacterium]